MNHYRQCLLQRKTKTGLTSQVAWIPELWAREGLYVKLRNEDGWLVSRAWGRRNEGQIIHHQTVYHDAFPSLNQ